MKNQIIKNFHWFIIAYAAYSIFLVYEEKIQEIEIAKSSVPPVVQKIKKAKKKIQEIEQFKKDLSQSKEKVKEVVRQIEKVQKQLPTDVNDTVVQELIGNIAQKLRVKNPSPTPGGEVLQGFYYSKEYKFTGIGTYLQHLIFFENLEKAERILNVKNLSLEMDMKSIDSRFPIVNLTTTVESYRYNPSYREKSVVNEIENKFKVQ